MAYLMCMSVGLNIVLCACPVPVEPEEGVRAPGTHFTGGCELSDTCWEPNLDLSTRPAGAFNP